ncbi:MAG TPA: 4-hydroxyphenylacetate isomerase [Bacillales bacterium]|nr:4-hydroxyphenylacetate isomerase [Bacillales bacterium]
MSTGKVKFSGILQEETVNIDCENQIIEVKGKNLSLQDLKLNAPISGTIYGTLLNYQGAMEALGEAVNEDPYKAPPKAPVLYIKPVNTVIGYGASIPMPADIDQLEMGAALGLVIGKKATRVAKAEALDYVTGYTVVNDVSVPHASVYRPAIRQKCRDGFCPVGPWVIERKAVENPDALTVRVYINNELRQENTTANLIRSVSQLIADVTDYMTLNEGDLLLVGVPENAPLAKAGDQVRIEISGVGILENTVVHENELQIGGAK